MSEKPDVVMPVPGAPAPDEGPITIEATWHHAPPTGAYESPPVAPVTAYDVVKDADGNTVSVEAKVLQPPARPTRKAGRQAEAKVKGATVAGAFVDEVQETPAAVGQDIPLEGTATLTADAAHLADGA